MPVLDPSIVDTIKRHLRSNKRGLTISDLSSRIKQNRNLAARYLDMLLISGQVEMQLVGAAKVYFLSQRVPISAMLEFSSDYVIVLDTEQKIIQVNERVLSLLSQKREEIVGKKFSECNDPFLTGFKTFTFPKDLQNFEDAFTELNCVLKGSIFHFRVKQVPTAFEDGNQGWTLIIEDITAKKSYEEALRMNEARYRGIVEDQTEFITRFRPDGTLVFVNNSYARYLERETSELLGQHFIPGICDKDRTVVEDAVRSLSAEHPLVTVECRILDQSRQQRWNVWTIRALFNNEGALHEYQGVGRDTTEKRESAHKINQYISQMDFFSRKLQEFIELSPDVDIFHAIGAGLEELLPDTPIAVSSYDSGSATLSVKSVLGEKERDCAGRHFGEDFFRILVPCDQGVKGKLLTGKVNPIGRRLHDLLHPYVPAESCRNFIDDLRLEKFYSVGLVWQDVLLGNMTFGLRKGSPLRAPALIETYARAASIALQRQIAENAYKESERKRAEEALKSSENYLLTIFNATQSGLVVIDPETRSIYDANSTAIALMGKEKSSLVGASCTEYLCTAENRHCPVIDLGQDLTRAEGVLRNSRGEERPIIKTVVPVQLGGRSYLLESFIDISERKRAEEALFAIEKRFQSLAEMLPQSVWECDDRGNVTFVNHRTYAMYGYTVEDVKNGMTIWQTIHPVDRERVLNDFIQGLAQEPEKFPTYHEFMSIRKDGSTFPLLTYHVPIVHDKKIIGMRGLGIDMTERKRTETALKESEERFRLLVESVPFGISFITDSGSIEYVNPAFEQICGYTIPEVPDLMTWAEKVFPDKKYRDGIFSAWLKHVQTFSGTKYHSDRVFHMHCRGGNEKDIHLRAVSFENGKVLVIIEDITDQMQVLSP